MITGTRALLEWYDRRRRHAWERIWRDPAGVQERALLRLVEAARDTEFGLAHGFDAIRSVQDYQARVPVRDYRELRPYLEQALHGDRSILWPGHTGDWIRTPGTTASPKLIPLTADVLAALRKAAADTFLVAVERVGSGQIMDGPMLLLGTRTTLQPIGAAGRVGDLSAFVFRGLPPMIRARCVSSPDICDIADWERWLHTVAELASEQDLRLIFGIPPWLMMFFEQVAHRHAANGRRSQGLGHWWRNLAVVIHGGVSFDPYAAQFDEWIGRRIERIEVYQAAEAVVGIQTERSGGLTLMLDYGVFYEFIPVEDLGSATPRRHTLADLELGRQYAVVVSTPAGLWSYALGDTVRFTKRDPLRLQITGRTQHHVSVSGENVIVEDVERALVRACRRTDTDVVEFTVAPRWPSHEEPQAGHDWLVEFRTPPHEAEDFARILDESLATMNAEYRGRRMSDRAMSEPRVTALPRGTFRRWLRDLGKLGDPNKISRVTNDRAVADALLAVARDLGRPVILPSTVAPSRA